MDRYYGLPVDGADLVWALASVAGLHRKPFDVRLLLQQFPPPYSVASLVSAAQALGFDTRFGPNKLDRIKRADLPCIAVLIAQPADDNPPAQSPAVAPPVEPAMSGDAPEPSSSVQAGDNASSNDSAGPGAADQNTPQEKSIG